MTMSTSAEETTKRQQPSGKWAQTSSGVAAPWQIYATSSAFVATPDVSTVPLDMMCPIMEIDFLTDVQEPKLDAQQDKEQLGLFVQENPLERAVLSLLTYAATPDEPKDEDVQPELGYEFPE